MSVVTANTTATTAERERRSVLTGWKSTRQRWRCPKTTGRGLLRYGFSLLELLAVVMIMAILAMIVIPRLTQHTRYAKVKACHQYRGDIDSSLERYYFDRGNFPSNLSDLTPDYYPDSIPVCPIDGSSYTIDATTGRISGHNHD